MNAAWCTNIRDGMHVCSDGPSSDDDVDAGAIAKQGVLSGTSQQRQAQETARGKGEDGGDGDDDDDDDPEAHISFIETPFTIAARNAHASAKARAATVRYAAAAAASYSQRQPRYRADADIQAGGPRPFLGTREKPPLVRAVLRLAPFPPAALTPALDRLAAAASQKPSEQRQRQRGKQHPTQMQMRLTFDPAARDGVCEPAHTRTHMRREKGHGEAHLSTETARRSETYQLSEQHGYGRGFGVHGNAEAVAHDVEEASAAPQASQLSARDITTTTKTTDAQALVEAPERSCYGDLAPPGTLERVSSHAFYHRGPPSSGRSSSAPRHRRQSKSANLFRTVIPRPQMEADEAQGQAVDADRGTPFVAGVEPTSSPSTHAGPHKRTRERECELVQAMPPHLWSTLWASRLGTSRGGAAASCISARAAAASAVQRTVPLQGAASAHFRLCGLTNGGGTSTGTSSNGSRESSIPPGPLVSSPIHNEHRDDSWACTTVSSRSAPTPKPGSSTRPRGPSSPSPAEPPPHLLTSSPSSLSPPPPHSPSRSKLLLTASPQNVQVLQTKVSAGRGAQRRLALFEPSPMRPRP
ncbi:hypothetical protein K437DRAFT_10795 [Tilletiaria anomala UBC 951]|uniref:Uncharacterized protein n=1 Tax=Tilletiaria anomala (strain ATCC 24038 / CBS 436.72 / UBC 951) TaxID=1037660 RepID=A0A066VGW3_TILAU|nr:uncharacterized protein K437DRAFT_10795 [Tilletiaria anomala UBC 951]KDN39543.1 hypothetical protein K437DRAFT_10795 [Tilletiaria anomala UBC 951]